MQDNSALYDLISNIQAKLNEDNTNSSTDTKNTENINESTQNDANNTTENNNTYTNTSTNTGNNNNFDFSNLDMNTILKMQNLLSKFNRNTPKKTLLYSLKPFLNQSRQDKLGEYITILSVMDALDIFKKGSDN